MQTYPDLQGKRVLISGASSGIGQACAEAFLAQGSQAALHFHKGSVDALVTHYPTLAVAVGGDLATERGCVAVVAEAVKALGSLDVLVCSAGIWRAAPISEVTAATLDEIFRINLFSLFYLVREALPSLGNGSSIVFLGSTAGQRGEAGHSPYAATKGALQTLCFSLAEELAPRTRVNVVAPGWVYTPMTDTVLTPERAGRIAAGVPLRRIADPQDIANAVLFLASDAARHITGEVLSVSGGALIPLPR